ncbi:hypothetical protein [Corynebacterium renale]|uniref:hypothetical protein n=1 Tax=Corynebacterium renale TaxID=1724 RepID=UPI000DFF7AFA|nr:hypothetical protein [Corynebacterium renale]STC97615.1 Uncharacterised protein [Corynebacterium renale]
MARTGDTTYRKLRARTLAGDNLICAWCNLPIDKTYRAPHPLSPSADHITPIAAGGHNHGPLQPMHLGCNKSAGAKGHRRTGTKRNHARSW